MLRLGRGDRIDAVFVRGPDLDCSASGSGATTGSLSRRERGPESLRAILGREMAKESIAIVRMVYCGPLSLDPDLLGRLGAVAGPETEFDFTDAYPDGPVVKGIEGVARIAANWPWDALHFEPERFFGVDAERVVVFVRATATGVGSGSRLSAGPRTSARSATGGLCGSRSTPTASRR